MPKPTLLKINQSQRERLSHIDFKACFLGTIRRSDLVTRFGIKEAAATRDITLYRGLAPENLEYDTKAKIYIRTPSFEPLFDYSPSQVLAALAHGFGDDFVGKHRALVPCEAPAKLNAPDLKTLSVLTRAIHQHKAVSLEYRSLSSGRSTRQVVPFVLVNNGLRWHIRGYDRKRSRFSDFVITRISNPEILEGVVKTQESREQDIQWNRIVELEIVPHPKLKHPKTIEADYTMKNGVLRINVRAAVAGYVLRLWNVDCSENHYLGGSETHLWLKNRQALFGVENLVIAPGYNQSNQTTFTS